MISQYLPPFASDEVKASFQVYTKSQEQLSQVIEREETLKQAIEILEKNLSNQAEELKNSETFVCHSIALVYRLV